MKRDTANVTINYGTGARELSNITNYVFEKLIHVIYDPEDRIYIAELRKVIIEDNSKFTIY